MRGALCVAAIHALAVVAGTSLKHALGSNADGVIVPQVRTSADVESIVADCRYPTGGLT